jgi:hypothetical protein
MVRDGATCPRSFTAPIFIRYLSFERPKHPKRAMVATDLDGDQNVDVRERTPPEERELVHARLRGDIEAIRAYGDAHPDDWTDVLFENEPTVRMVALFAGPHLEEHDRALRALVEHPDFLDVRQTRFSRNHLEAMLVEARQLSTEPRAFLMSGIGRGRLRLQLGADQESLAATLLQRFGDAVDLKVGSFAFPMTAESDVGPPLPTPDVTLISLEGVDVSLSHRVTVTSGRVADGSLDFSNYGTEEIALETNGVVTARILDPSTFDVVGGFVGAQAMPLVRFPIAPGEIVRVPLLVGAASFKRSLGYAVPPGDWMMDAIVKVHDRGDRRVQPLPVEIVARSL